MKIILFTLAVTLLFGSLANSQSKPAAPELVDVEGRKMEVVRSGTGGPTVVFEAGFAPRDLTWDSVQPLVANFASTLSYAHFGLGSSDAPSAPRSASQIAAELHALLKSIGAKPPYVLVGHSMGGLYTRVFAINYPSEVAGPSWLTRYMNVR